MKKKSIFIYLFRLHRVLVAPRGLLVAACGLKFPDQGSNLGPLHWECGVLSTGPPGKSLEFKNFEMTSDL